jgi:spore coat protein CotF
MTTNTNLTEKEIINDALATEKQLLHAYGTYIAEATCQNLRNELSKIITQTQQVQFEIFNAMKNKGWYDTKNATIDEVSQAVMKYQQAKSSM